MNKKKVLQLSTLFDDFSIPDVCHFHVDDYRLLHSKDDLLFRRLSFILLAPSISPCYDNNPGFLIVQLAPKRQTLVDYEQYYVDLVMATGKFPDKTLSV